LNILPPVLGIIQEQRKPEGSGFSNMYPLGTKGVIAFIEIDNQKCNQVKY